MMQKILALIGTFVLVFFGTEVNQIKVIDGDTFDCEVGRVRILNINTPERGERCFKESKEKLENLLEGGVKLKRDIQNKDKYNRLLRHVNTNKTSVGIEMIASGNAKALCIFPNYAGCGEAMDAEVSARMLKEGCLFSPSNRTCLKVIDMDCDGSWFEIENFCKGPVNLSGVWAENRGNDKVELSGHLNSLEKIKMHLKLYKQDAVYLFDKNGFISFGRCH